MAQQLISERAQRLLKALVERYIVEGQPISSRTLLEDSGLPISSATVRNVMADLEEQGYVMSPHTSAGRVPTVHGYRFFVDSLITMRPLGPDALSTLQRELHPDKSSAELVQTASRMLATITAQAGLVTLPRLPHVALRQIEFLPLSDNRVLVILVVNEREVQNRVIHPSRRFTREELMQAANLINHQFAGKPLRDVREAIVNAMQADKASIDAHLEASLELAAQSLEDHMADETARDYVVTGEASLIDYASADDIDKLRDLFDAFERKRDILELVDRCIKADGMQIFIGDEAGYEVLGDFSVVTAPYQVGNERLGVLGVIGPTRMAYHHVIPIVDVTARMLSAALRRC
ncbi:MAG: heat-inducible transcriptional repressor HrcA [Spongiibacteraceae bacterium]|jgi:heat-inducible transcriptional repressor|nr:heat-inducible transcriptional repressor HrcA [Spongiibacteraceae bacterium]